MDPLTIPSPALQALCLNPNLDVAGRLADLRVWLTHWQDEDRLVHQEIESLNPSSQADVLRGSQIGSLGCQLVIQLTQQPLDLDPEKIQSVGFTGLRQHLSRQYAGLGEADRRLWLTNLVFLLTPTLRLLIDKLDAIRRYRSLGQTRCFLLGGISGVGKTSCLNWYTYHHLPTVQATCNHVPVIKIDAPVSNRSPKPLYLRMLMACGATSVRGNEEHYLELLELYFQRCGVELLIVDEVEHITQSALRRRLLELSNLTGVPIVCASCNPIAWTTGDIEIQGRWNDYFELTQFTGPRLDAFLSLLDLVLPFEQDSRLGVREITDAKGQTVAAGPAHYIEQWTDGILREIMVLVTDACLKAIAVRAPCLSLDLSNHAWRDIKRVKVMNFLDHLRAQKGDSHE